MGAINQQYSILATLTIHHRIINSRLPSTMKVSHFPSPPSQSRSHRISLANAVRFEWRIQCSRQSTSPHATYSSRVQACTTALHALLSSRSHSHHMLPWSCHLTLATCVECRSSGCARLSRWVIVAASCNCGRSFLLEHSPLEDSRGYDLSHHHTHPINTPQPSWTTTL
ncbi:hypothetical protein BDY17DRAFT_290564, partial [Neohortaea acidophila]